MISLFLPVLKGHGVANLRVGAAVHDPGQQRQEDRETHADQAQHLDTVPRRKSCFFWLVFV